MNTANSFPFSTSSSSSITAPVLSPNGIFSATYSFRILNSKLFPCVRANDIRRRFSPAEIFLFEDTNISQWFKAFIAIRRLCLLDANVLTFVR